MNVNVDIISDEKRIRPKDSEVNRLYGDNKLLRELTDWVPDYGDLIGFKKGLLITAEWFSKKENLVMYRPNSYAVWNWIA